LNFVRPKHEQSDVLEAFGSKKEAKEAQGQPPLIYHVQYHGLRGSSKK